MTREAKFEGAAFAAAEEMLREAGEVRFEARGEEMLPAIYPGEELILHRARMRDVRVGDVVLFQQEKRWHLERVRKILPGIAQPCLITGADAGLERQEPVFAEDLLGRAAFVVRGGDEKVLARKNPAIQKLIGAAVRHAPVAAKGCIKLHKMRGRFAVLRQGAGELFGGRVRRGV